MPNRRHFVKTFTKGISGTLMLPVIDSLPFPTTRSFAQPVGMDEEKYWMQVRGFFPLSKEHVYLNNATMGPSPYVVIEEEHAVNLEINSNVHHDVKKKQALADMARFVGAKTTNIAFTHNVTEGINIGVWSLNLQQGDEVIISTHEHVGNALPWLNRAKLDGIVLKPIKLAPTANEVFEIVKSAITSKTKVIALPHITCTTGQVLPVKDICNFAREKNIITLIDGAHGPGMLSLNLQEMGCDMYASCCHKWMLGPKGTGFLYIRDECIEKSIPKFIGAYGDTGWDMLADTPLLKGYVGTAHRFFYGTQSDAHYAGISAAIRFHEEIGIQKIENRIHQLSAYVQQQLQKIGTDKIEILTPTEDISRAGAISFIVKNTDYLEVQRQCYVNKLTIRAVPENNVNCLRVSTHIYNSFEEIDQLMALIKKIAPSEREGQLPYGTH